MIKSGGVMVLAVVALLPWSARAVEADQTEQIIELQRQVIKLTQEKTKLAQMAQECAPVYYYKGVSHFIQGRRNVFRGTPSRDDAEAKASLYENCVAEFPQRYSNVSGSEASFACNMLSEVRRVVIN